MKTNEQWWQRAQKVLPGGVNSPVRAFKSVGGTPPFMVRGKGSHITDVEGTDYIDYVLSWGPLVLGHVHPAVRSALEKAIGEGTSFGAPTPKEVEMGEWLVSHVPGLEMVRMVNSGTEATMSAIRLARGATGRDLIIKMEGCYHGHVDSLLVKAGSGALTFGQPTSPGISSAAAATTLVAPYNDIQTLEELLEQYAGRVAAVILEPVPGNMGVILPRESYLSDLKTLTRKHGSLLIFDEVMSGFRAGWPTAGAYYGVVPDLMTFGKVIGGGLPVGGYGGRQDLMEQVSPSGPIYQAGTLSGNPLAMAAGLATLRVLAQEKIWQSVADKTRTLAEELAKLGKEIGIPLTVPHQGSMFALFFHPGPICTFEDVMACDAKRYGTFHKAMLQEGIYLAPSAYETGFLSTEHTSEDMDRTLEAARKALASCR